MDETTALVLTALATAISAIMATFSIIFAVISSNKQHKLHANSIEQEHNHNKRSVMPIWDAILAAPGEKIGIILQNVGYGPLVIKKFEIVKLDDNNKMIETSGDIDDFLEYKNLNKEDKGKIECIWSGFRDDSVMAPGSNFTLFKFDKKDGADYDRFKEIRLEFLLKLSYLEIRIEYEDIYGTNFKKSTPFNFFRGHYEKESETGRQKQNTP